MCVPNYEKTHLFTQNIIQAKQIQDMPVNKKQHVPYGKILNLGNFNFAATFFKFASPVSILKINNNYLNTPPTNCYFSIPEQPPRCC